MGKASVTQEFSLCGNEMLGDPRSNFNSRKDGEVSTHGSHYWVVCFDLSVSIDC